ncbi:MAG TPA: FIST N-terminal domain-containing protein [Opitutaceae bacterium]|nr:FIST N-terminal domain-containing protein [Opitutaceae bacterium]
MRSEQRFFDPTDGWRPLAGDLAGERPHFVLTLGGRMRLKDPRLLAALRAAYPGARLLFASTAGEIAATAVTEEQVTTTAVSFRSTRTGYAAVSVRSQFESRAAGLALADRLRGNDLVHVFVLSDGQLVNGTELAVGLSEGLGRHVTISGGLAGDGERFEETVVGLDEVPAPGRIAAIGFYGHALRVGLGSSGGWSPTGPEQVATASEGNLLFRLNDQPALECYSAFMGDKARNLPGSAICHPFYVMPPGGKPPVVRSILGVEPSTHCLIFAGDIPTGSRIRFMHASAEDLVAGAGKAAESARLPRAADLAICVSCVGRRLALGSRTNEEIAAVRAQLGPGPLLTGFYSYGELAPADLESACQLHNQTMTITTFAEN